MARRSHVKPAVVSTLIEPLGLMTGRKKAVDEAPKTADLLLLMTQQVDAARSRQAALAEEASAAVPRRQVDNARFGLREAAGDIGPGNCRSAFFQLKGVCQGLPSS